MVHEMKDGLVNLVKIFLICAGLWPKTKVTESYFINKLYFLYSIFMRAYFVFFYMLLVAELVRLIIKNYQFEIIISSFSVIVTITKMLGKVIIYLKNNVLKMLDDVIEKEREIMVKSDEIVHKLYLSSINTGIILSKLLCLLTLGAVLVLNISGIYANSQLIKYNKLNNDSLETHFLYQFWFPADKLEHLGWIYSLSLINAYSGFIYNVATHLVLLTLLMYSAAHLTLLQYRLRICINGDIQEDQMGDIISELKEIIREHNYLIRFTRTLNDYCKNIVMMEFVLSSFDLASVAVTIIQVKVEELGYLPIYFILLILQIFCLAWTCNEVSIQSKAVGTAAYASKWYLLNREGKQLIHILMIRTQKPLHMTIGPFGPMTTNSFVMILKAAYSYVSLMK